MNIKETIHRIKTHIDRAGDFALLGASTEDLKVICNYLEKDSELKKFMKGMSFEEVLRIAPDCECNLILDEIGKRAVSKFHVEQFRAWLETYEGKILTIWCVFSVFESNQNLDGMAIARKAIKEIKSIYKQLVDDSLSACSACDDPNVLTLEDNKLIGFIDALKLRLDELGGLSPIHLFLHKDFYSFNLSSNPYSKFNKGDSSLLP